MDSAATVSIAGVLKADAAGSTRLDSKRRSSRQVAVDLLAIGDALLVVSTGLVPAAIYARGSIPVDWQLVVQSAALGGVIAWLCLKAWGHYDTTRIHDLPLSPLSIGLAVLVAVMAVSGFAVPPALRDSGGGMIWNLLWWAIATTALLASHLAARWLFGRWTAVGHFDERIAVFGAGPVARRLHEHLRNGVYGIRFVGVFDDRTQPGRVNGEGLEVTGNLATLLEVAREGGVDRIIVSLPPSADKRISLIVKNFEAVDASVHVVTHVAGEELSAAEGAISRIGPVGLIEVQHRPLGDWAAIVKRLEDIVVGALLLALSLPLWPLIALAIKLDSRGPVLFRQRRRGLNQRIFEVLKFRSMTVLEDGADVRQAERGDLRVTRVGRWLRVTSLDELPQLVNVLRGEMSLVGPRPHALVHDDEFGEQVPAYVNRTKMKPGITGLAQVRGLRGETRTSGRLEARVAHDIAYIRNWSLLLDLKILFLTVRAIVVGENAH